jgi:potassium-dependent mechanosensitive channel
MFNYKLSKKNLFLVILITAGLIAMLVASIAHFYLYFNANQSPIKLAVVAPLTGEEAVSGQAIREGVELAVEQLNKSGGIDGHYLKVLAFDDKNTPEQAVIAAQEAIKSGAVAVIGHLDAAILAAAKPIYTAAQIPVLTLAADLNPASDKEKTVVKHLLNDETYEIRFLANYLRNVIGEKTVHLLYEDSTRGVALAQAFDETLQRFGTRVVYQWAFPSSDGALEDRVQKAAKELVDGKLPGTILVIANPAESARAVAILRTNGVRNAIAGTRSFATQSFKTAFNQKWQGSGSVESALTGTLLSAPMLYDVAGAAAQNFSADFFSRFHHSSDWLAAYANDAANLIITTLHSQNQIHKYAEAEITKTLAISLTNRTNTDPFLGLNGLLVIDPKGRDIRPPLIGVFDGSDLISALIQLVPIREEGTGNLLQQFMEGRALYVNDRFMYRTNVVYSGIRPLNIANLSVREGTAEQEFLIWFRWRGDFSPQDIVFKNAVTPIRLETPENEGNIGEMQYRVYRVRGKFFVNFSSVPRAFDTKLVGFAFTHRLLSRHNLMYVSDVLGMGVTHNKTLQSLLTSGAGVTSESEDNGIREILGTVLLAIRNFLSSDDQQNDPLINLLSRGNLLAGTPGWIIEKAWLSQEIVSRSSDGDPKFVGFGHPNPEFSQLEMGTILKPDLIRARDVIPSQLFIYIATFSIIGVLLAHMLKRKKSRYDWKIQSFALHLISWPLLTVSLGNLLLDYALLYATPSVVNLIWMAYQTALWLVPAGLVAVAIEQFVWIPLEKRTQRKIPNIMRLLTNIFVLGLAMFGIIANVFEQTITNLLAATGLSAMIVGLAVKDSIANVFAGIILNLEKPFTIGDSIKVANTTGKVLDITWRTTRIELDAGHIVTLPNAKISEVELHNLSRASNGYECILKVMVGANINPEKVRPLLEEAIKDCPYIMIKDGAANVTIRTRNTSNVNQVWLTSYTIGFQVEKMVFIFRSEDYFWPRLWKGFRDAGLTWEDEHGNLFAKDSISLNKA